MKNIYLILSVILLILAPIKKTYAFGPLAVGAYVAVETTAGWITGFMISSGAIVSVKTLIMMDEIDRVKAPRNNKDVYMSSVLSSLQEQNIDNIMIDGVEEEVLSMYSLNGGRDRRYGDLVSSLSDYKAYGREEINKTLREQWKMVGTLNFRVGIASVAFQVNQGGYQSRALCLADVARVILTKVMVASSKGLSPVPGIEGGALSCVREF